MNKGFENVKLDAYEMQFGSLEKILSS